MTGYPRQQGEIVRGDILYADAPGFDAFDIATLGLAADPQTSRFLVSTRQEDYRGGRIDVVEFVAPSPDVIMQFRQPATVGYMGSLGAIAEMHTMHKLAATVTYNDAPAGPPRGGVYYNALDPRRRHDYVLLAGILSVERPELHTPAERELRQISNYADEHSAEAHRIVDEPEQLDDIVKRFGWAMGLDELDGEAFVRRIGEHVRAMQTARRLQAYSEIR